VLQAIRGSGAPGWLLVAAAVAVGAAAAELYLRAGAARLALTVLAPAPLLFLALFLFNSDVSRLSLSTETAQAAGERPRAPVVLIAFDELPVNSLLDAHGQIDAARFPNFARLARGSTWFEHATTVGEGTTHAIPAILTGRFPKAGEFPVYTDHRQNLFTLFGGATQLHVSDQETHLCPPSLCPNLEGSLGHRTATLAEDTGVVYLHELLPDDLTGGIPSIANGWGSFLQDASGHDDPGRIDPAFLRSLRPQTSPSGWYLHLLLPHSPWTPAFRPVTATTCEPRPAGARTRSGTRTRPRSTSTGSATCCSWATPTGCSGGCSTVFAPPGSTTTRCLSSPPTTASASAPARSAGHCRRPTGRTSPTCRCL
jgi:hypothetical protein